VQEAVEETVAAVQDAVEETAAAVQAVEIFPTILRFTSQLLEHLQLVL
jgi:hypothetical protein